MMGNAMLDRNRMVSRVTVCWTVVGVLLGVWLAYNGMHVIIVPLTTLGGLASGYVWSALMWRFMFSYFQSAKYECDDERHGLLGGESETESIQGNAARAGIEFTASLDPAVAKDAARIWFWRFVRRHRLWQLGSGIIFFLAAALLAFWFDYAWFGVLFLIFVGLNLIYFPLFRFLFRRAAVKFARRWRTLRFKFCGDDLNISGEGHEIMTISLAATDYILERPKYFIVSYSRYGWVWLPHSELPNVMLEILRSHPRYS